MKKIIRKFRNSAATSPLTAKTPEQLNLRHGFLLKRLINQGVIADIGNNKYYLHEENLIKYSASRRMNLLLFAGVLLLIFLIYLVSYFLFFKH